MTLAVVLRASILTFQQFHCAWLMKFMCIYFTLTSHPTPFPLPKPFPSFPFFTEAFIHALHWVEILIFSSIFHRSRLVSRILFSYCCCSWFRDSCIITCIVSARLYEFTASEWVSVFVCPAHKSNTKCEFRICNHIQLQQQQHHNSRKCQTPKNVDMIVMLRGWPYYVPSLPFPPPTTVPSPLQKLTKRALRRDLINQETVFSVR